MNLKRHLYYLKYVVLHKWFVFVASCHIGSSIWLAIIHDISKFHPSEWFPYARTFYAPDGAKQYIESDAFNFAWLKHQHRNPHHWQHWLLKRDDGQLMAMEMPRRFVYEMVADWMGAGRAINGEWECKAWYLKNKDKIILHEKTRELVECILWVEDNYDFAPW